MSEAQNLEQPIINDAITAEDAGFSSDIGAEAQLSEGEITETEGEEASSEEVSGEAPETEGELKEQIEEAVEDGASEEEIKDMIKEFTLKVNGKEVVKKIDLSDEDAIRRELQLAAAGQSAMQKSKELEKLYGNELQRLKDKPWEVLEELGLDTDQMAESRIRSKVEEMKKSPEERERETMRKEIEDYRSKLKQLEEEKETAVFEQLREQEAVKLEKEIENALDSHQTLPKSAKTVTRIANAMVWAMENGYDNIQVKDVIPSVEAEIQHEIHGLLEELPEELFEKYVGKKQIDRYRKKRLKKVQTSKLSDVKPTAQAPKSSEESSEAKRIRSKNYFKNL